MPLPIAPLDTDLKVMKVVGDAKIVKHLASLGFVYGAIVRVLDSTLGGTVVSILGGRMALGKDVARMIIVSPA